MSEPTNFEALENMTDETGILQHESNPIHDYSIDDQARALIVLSRFSNDFLKEDLALTYLNYIKEAKRQQNKWFNNYKDAEGNWMKVRQGIEQTQDTLQDCYGRAMWALSEFLSSEYRIKSKKEAENLFFKSLELTDKLTYPHSLAFTIIALSKLPKNKQTKQIKKINSKLTKKLIDSYETKNWMTYCVGRIPQAMLLAGKINPGKESLDLIIDKCFDKDATFHPTKNPWGDEQPIEAGVMTEACINAYKIFKEEKYLQAAKNSFEWFNGQNSANLNMIGKNRAVYDAITKQGTRNANQGAESLLAYLMAVSALKE